MSSKFISIFYNYTLYEHLHENIFLSKIIRLFLLVYINSKIFPVTNYLYDCVHFSVCMIISIKTLLNYAVMLLVVYQLRDGICLMSISFKRCCEKRRYQRVNLEIQNWPLGTKYFYRFILKQNKHQPLLLITQHQQWEKDKAYLKEWRPYPIITSVY